MVLDDLEDGSALFVAFLRVATQVFEHLLQEFDPSQVSSLQNRVVVPLQDLDSLSMVPRVP